MACTRELRGWVAAAALLCAGCYEGPEEDGSGDGSTSDATSNETSSSPVTSASTTGPTDCIAGQEMCICLEEQCVGSLQCVEGLCQRGPEFDGPDDDFDVIGGVRLPIEVDIMADSYEWTQVSGPQADALAGTDSTTLLVDVPADANPGSQMVFRINAVRNTIEATFDVRVNIHAAQFSDFLAEVDDPEQAGTVEGLGLLRFEAWVLSSEGFISRFSPEGNFIERIDLEGAPMGGVFGDLPVGDDDEIDVMYVANAGTERIQAVVENTGEVRMVTNQMTAGGALGPVDSVALFGNGELFFTNRTGGQIFHYYFGDDGMGNEQWMTEEFLADLGPNPNAITTGPDPGYLYVGTVGKVWRVPVLDDVAGDAELYFDIGDSADPLLEVDGITFDFAQTMYVGVSGTNTLYMARYNGGQQVEATRTFTDVGGGVSSFVNVQFGSGDFGNGTLYWTNPATSAVGRLQVFDVENDG